MLDASFLALLFVIALAATFDFVNGFHDSANAIATVVSTRVLTPVVALLMAAIMNFLGAISGTAVAKVVGAGIVASDVITIQTVGAGVGAAIIWEIITYFLALPTSGSHALIGGVAGASIATAGFGVLIEKGVTRTLLGLT